MLAQLRDRPSCLYERQFMRRDDPPVALAGGDQDQVGAAADDADLEQDDGAGMEHRHREMFWRANCERAAGRRT